MSIDTTALFCCLDDFCLAYEEWERHGLLPGRGRKRRRRGKLCLSEMLFIMVLFHLSPFRTFKAFYTYGVGCQHRSLFGELPCHARFVQLMPRLFMPLCVLLHALRGEGTGVYVADSTKLAVCRNIRISRHRVFRDLAARGRSSTGWFFGLKLHMVINHRGEIMAVKITPGNTDDRAVLNAMTRGLRGKILADKGYISAKLFAGLWKRGLHLITGIRRNMKNHLMTLFDKTLLRRRFIVETVFGTLKQEMGLEHSRHRSTTNACVHIISCLAAYALKTQKPSMSFHAKPIKAYP